MDSSLLNDLMTPDAYPHAAEDLALLETHISWVLLAGDYAYKIKKPVRNSFLDYTGLTARQHFCEAELRLNQRFAAELYLDVVPIVLENGRARFAGAGQPIEFAVRMRRFPADALMAGRLASGLITTQQVRALAVRVASFHQLAAQADSRKPFGSPDEVYQEATDNFRDILDGAQDLSLSSETVELVNQIKQWTSNYFAAHRGLFVQRQLQGHVRECHGDLHLGNIVWWHNEFIPFDGIEFCEAFRWIDTFSDVAFTAMDFAALGKPEFSHSFVNAYLEETGDYEAVRVLTWYLVFRAMVRAKVAALRAMQLPAATTERSAALEDLQQHLQLAWQLTNQHQAQPRLWITHGVSGSGKTTGSEQIVQSQGALRLRADVERKRLAVLESDRYTEKVTNHTYQRLAQLAEQLLRAGECVIVDATFLKKEQRNIFHDLARSLQVPLNILHFEADEATLMQRIDQRRRVGLDASDADGTVLRQQLEMQEPLDDYERACLQ